MHPLIPAEKREAVRRALVQTFGSAPPDAVEPVSGGLSTAPVLRLSIAGAWWLLRIERPRDGLSDPDRTYPCLRGASTAGIAPELLWSDAVAGVAISRFIDKLPLAEHHGGRQGLLCEVAELARRIRALPLFPPLVHFLQGIDGLIERLQGFGAIDHAAIAPHLVRWTEIRDAYAWEEAEMTSSHNDLNPANLVYDGRRLWVVDWETAFRNDPLVDLAVTANFFGADEAEEALLLEASFPDRRPRRDRLRAMRGICRVYHGVVMMNSALAQGCRVTQQVRGMVVPPLAEVRQALATGRLDLAVPEQRLTLGKAMLMAA